MPQLILKNIIINFSTCFLCHIGTGVTVNAVHPGTVFTDIVRHMGFQQLFISKVIVRSLLWLFIKSPQKGSQPVLFAALDPSLDNVTGSILY